MLKWARRRTRRPRACGKTDGSGLELSQNVLNSMSLNVLKAILPVRKDVSDSFKFQAFISQIERLQVGPGREAIFASQYSVDSHCFCRSFTLHQASKESDLDTVSGAPSR